MPEVQGVVIKIGGLVLIRQTAWKGRHKIQDRWENKEYQVVGLPIPGVLAYKVQTLDGGKKILHRNLLLPFQVRLRQKGWNKRTLQKLMLKMMRLLKCQK